MLFAIVMKVQKLYFFGSIGLALLASFMLLAPDKKDAAFSELVKIALRDAGNKLLLTNQDSTSLILPIQKVDDSKFRLSFEKSLTIDPDSLVLIVEKSFKKVNLPLQYQIEVKQCEDYEVAYSFLKFASQEKSIIPCSGRFLPQKCYVIEVRFLEKTVIYNFNAVWIILLIGSVVMTFVLFSKPKKEQQTISINENGISLGKFKFYPKENKLILSDTEIPLSKKELELLTVFVENTNKIIKREELSKKVWEDHGVFVGRSLDTFISKLRKKLSDDDSIKLTNVHGIGYMLEVKNSH